MFIGMMDYRREIVELAMCIVFCVFVYAVWLKSKENSDG